MHKEIASEQYSTQPLPLVHAKIEELQIATQVWLESSGAPSWLRTKIERTLLRASLAIESATLGGRRQPQLARAKEAMVPCLGLFRYFCMRGHLKAALYDEARRRVDQILSGIDRLLATRATELPKVELPEIEPATAEGSSNAVLTIIEELVTRIHKLFKPATAPPPSSEDPPEDS